MARRSLAALAFLVALASTSSAAARIPAIMGDRDHALVLTVGALFVGDTSLRAESVGGGLTLGVGEAFGGPTHGYYRVMLASDLVHGILHPSVEVGFTAWFFGLHAGLGWRTGALWLDPAAPRPGGPALHGGIDILIPLAGAFDTTDAVEVDEIWLRIFFEGGGGYRCDDGQWTGFGQLGVAVLYEDV